MKTVAWINERFRSQSQWRNNLLFSKPKIPIIIKVRTFPTYWKLFELRFPIGCHWNAYYLTWKSEAIEGRKGALIIKPYTLGSWKFKTSNFPLDCTADRKLIFLFCLHFDEFRIVLRNFVTPVTISLWRK